MREIHIGSKSFNKKKLPNCSQFTPQPVSPNRPTSEEKAITLTKVKQDKQQPMDKVYREIRSRVNQQTRTTCTNAENVDQRSVFVNASAAGKETPLARPTRPSHQSEQSSMEWVSIATGVEELVSKYLGRYVSVATVWHASAKNDSKICFASHVVNIIMVIRKYHSTQNKGTFSPVIPHHSRLGSI